MPNQIDLANLDCTDGVYVCRIGTLRPTARFTLIFLFFGAPALRLSDPTKALSRLYAVIAPQTAVGPSPINTQPPLTPHHKSRMHNQQSIFRIQQRLLPTLLGLSLIPLLDLCGSKPVLCPFWLSRTCI